MPSERKVSPKGSDTLQPGLAIVARPPMSPLAKPDPKTVTIYTDGACIRNPGPGGYGVVLLRKERRKELSGGYRLTTNNRMELMAAIAGLEALRRPCVVTLHTDSKYVVDSIALGWAERWRAKGWMRSRTAAAR